MRRLRQSDLAKFSRALGVLYADTDAATLSKRVLTSLRGLFDCDFASFSLMDLRQGRWHLSLISPVVREWPGVEVYQKYLRDDPAVLHIMRTRTKRALKISDFYGLREYRSSKLYAEMFRPVGCDRRLGFAVQGAPPVTLAATLNRQGRDFTEEERALLDLLRPHLFQANTLAHADQLAAAARLQTRAQPLATFGVGLIELDAQGKIQSLTGRAEALLRVYFPEANRQLAGGRLPPKLAPRTTNVLAMGGLPSPGKTLLPSVGIRYFQGPDGRQLKVRPAGDRQLLLEERDDQTTLTLAGALGLTPREGEVLFWVAEAKTNWAISRILDISESTVGKHMERVLAKLRVPNRTAAVRALAEAWADF